MAPTHRTAMLLAGLLAGCAGGVPTVSDAGTEPVTGTFPGIRAHTTIDPARLDGYAATALPPYYLHAEVVGLDNGGAAITDAGATLGRVLFHDRQLSVNGHTSCASCHLPGLGFTDAARLSAGFDGGLTAAHSMRLANARWYAGGGFFWDKRAPTLEAQATMPVVHPVEMGFDGAHGGIAALIARMDTLPYYPELFTLAFGSTVITEGRIQQALAQFIRSMASTGSRWDDGYADTWNAAAPDRGLNQPLPNLTAVENRGRQLFLLPPQQGGAGCAGCHVPPTFSLAANARSNGLDAGEATIFKSPSLKNVAVSGPYMHDGRFATLGAVIDHYADGVQAGPALDQRLRTPQGQPLRLALTPADRAALVAFLGTLTDTALLSDPRFGDPFRQ